MKKLLKNPWVLCATVVAFAVVLLFVPGMGAFIGGGAILKAFTSLVAGAVLMVLVWISRRVWVIFKNEKDAEDVHDHEVARSIILAGLYLSFAIVVASIFG